MSVRLVQLSYVAVYAPLLRRAVQRRCILSRLTSRDKFVFSHPRH